jgi:hypothetical protein
MAVSDRAQPAINAVRRDRPVAGEEVFALGSASVPGGAGDRADCSRHHGDYCNHRDDSVAAAVDHHTDHHADGDSLVYSDTYSHTYIGR